MFVTLDRSLNDRLKDRSQPETTREINNELFQFAYQNWNRLLDFESDDSPGNDSPTLYFGLGSRRRARSLIQSGSNHRLYEPDPHRFQIFLDEYPNALADQDWKVGTGLWLEEGFFDCDQLKLDVQTLYRRLYNPLPIYMAEQPAILKSDPALIVQVGALFYRDVIEAFKSESIPVLPLQLDYWNYDSLVEQFQQSSAQRLFSINLIEDLPELCAQTGVHYISWEIDPSISPYDEVSADVGASTSIYTYRRKNVLRLRAVGYDDVEYCPLASNPQLRQPREDVDESYDTPISFVGSSMRQNAREQLNTLVEFLEGREDGAIEWSGLLEWIDRWKDSPPDWDEDTLGDVQAVLEELGIPFEIELGDERVCPSLIVGEYRAYQKRASVVETVGNHFDIDVWGDRGWVDHVGEKGTYRGEAGHGDELTDIYNASAINLDVNRIYQPNIVTMRVFDAMACGSVVLSEKSEAIESLLTPGEDCVLYEGKEGLLDTIEGLLNDEERREAIGRRARQSIEDEHSITHRLRTMDF